MARDRILQSLLVVAVLCSVVMTAFTVRRELIPRQVPTPRQFTPRAVDDWESVVADGRHRVGSVSAPVTILEFSDFQCPFCRRFAESTAPTLLEKYDGQIAWVFRHWPLAQHPSARMSALAAECAGAQDKFWAMHDAIFARQDTLDKVQWTVLAGQVGLYPASFEACLTDPSTGDAVDRDVRAALAIGNPGTPAVIVNGVLYPVADLGLLDAAIDSTMRVYRDP